VFLKKKLELTIPAKGSAIGPNGLAATNLAAFPPGADS